MLEAPSEPAQTITPGAPCTRQPSPTELNLTTSTIAGWPTTRATPTGSPAVNRSAHEPLADDDRVVAAESERIVQEGVDLHGAWGVRNVIQIA